VRALTPAASYGLIMWSHGTGWLPYETAPRRSRALDGNGEILTRNDNFVPINNGATQFSIGLTAAERKLDIDKMERALPEDLNWDFIAFDACYMGGIEVVYQLRDRARYTISSTCEVLAQGFPYTDIVSSMMANQADLIGIARKTYDFYSKQSDPMYRTVSIAVLDNSKLDALAAEVKNIVTLYPKTKTDIPRTTIQDFGYNLSLLRTFYDLGDFMDKTWPEVSMDGFNQALSNAIVVKYNCDYIIGTYPLTKFSGLSTYLPGGNPTLDTVYSNDSRFSWPSASGLKTMIR